jgi:hypothetical protein
MLGPAKRPNNHQRDQLPGVANRATTSRDARDMGLVLQVLDRAHADGNVAARHPGDGPQPP